MAPTLLYIANKSITNEQAIAAGADPEKGPYRDGQMDAVVEVDMQSISRTEERNRMSARGLALFYPEQGAQERAVDFILCTRRLLQLP